jgi:isopentenyl diphosphate isomerase/L-lactate dehydrogenase-like FMN-dependent dehydrogenase
MLSETSGEFLTLHELVKAARNKLPANIWDYLIGGADTETTVRRNRLALDSLAFRPRVLRDVSNIDLSRRVMGKSLRIPVMLAPVGSLESFDAEGGATVTKAATEFGVPMFLSSVSQPGIEATAAAAPGGMRVYQLYVRGDDAFVDDHLKRAMAAGYEAFCLTVDTAIYSRRERDISTRFAKPWRRGVVGMDHQASLNWSHVKRFRDTYDIPLILKGIATAEDAAIACEHGVAGVYVSNHGGRQLDHGRGALDVLPEVVAAVKGRAASLSTAVSAAAPTSSRRSRSAPMRWRSAGSTSMASRPRGRRASCVCSSSWRRSFGSRWACWASTVSPSSTSLICTRRHRSTRPMSTAPFRSSRRGTERSAPRPSRIPL